MQQFIFETKHEFYYSNKGTIPISDVIDSLVGLEKLVHLSPGVLSALTGIEIDGAEVYIDTIESGSLVEDVIIKLLFKDEAGLHAFLEKAHVKIGDGVTRNVLVGSVLAVLVGYGALLAANAMKSNSTTTITANNNVIINVGAGEVDMTPEAFKAVVEAAVKDKKGLANSAVKIMKPARSDKDARLVLDDSDTLNFSSQVIAATPPAVEINRQEKVEHLSDVDLQIRATNLDSKKQGWAGLIPNKVDRRLKLILDANVMPAQLAGKFKVRADVSIYYRLVKSGSASRMIPDHILVREIIEK